MKYSFTFDTVAAYLAAKGSSGAIYAALVTNSGGYVSRTAISTIKSTGQTFIDAFNVIVPREQGGEIGDTLLYKGGTYYWLKGRAVYSSSSLGGIYATYSNKRLAITDYTVIGFVGHREGAKCLIFSDVDSDGVSVIGQKKWSSKDGYHQATSGQAGALRIVESGGDGVSTINKSNVVSVQTAGWTPAVGDYTVLKKGNAYSVLPIYSNVRRRNGSRGVYSDTWVASASMEWAEMLFENGSVYQYTYPIKRSSWEYVVSKVMANEALTDYKTGIYTTEGDRGANVVASQSGLTGTATIEYTCNGRHTINPADYNYDFDTWYRSKVMIQFPTASGAVSQLSGKENTACMHNCVDGADDYNASESCFDYSISGVSDFAAGKWWMPCLREMCYLMKEGVGLKKKGYNIAQSACWSSTQDSATTAWTVSFSFGYVLNAYNKSLAYYVFAVTAFHI